MFPEKEVPALGAGTDNLGGVLIEVGRAKDGVPVHVQLNPFTVPVAKGFLTQDTDPIPFSTELIDPVAPQRNTVGLKEQKSFILAEPFPAQDRHLDKGASSQHIAAGRPAYVVIASHSGRAPTKMIRSQFLEFLTQPERAIFPVNQEKLGVLTPGVFDPADELDQFDCCIHVEGRTLEAKLYHYAINNLSFLPTI